MCFKLLDKNIQMEKEMHKVNWNYKSSLLEPSKINEFSKRFSISYVMSTVLLNRGIETEEQLKEYLTKSLEGIHNPLLLPDMEKAAQRIIKAIEEKEKIVIYGDYDVDGVTSTSVLYHFLSQNGAEVEYYIPDRFTEGYGLNIKAINRISKKGTKLLITVDCGITSVGEVELAKAQGMEVIITDHHTCKEKLPGATAVVNPKRPDSEYPFKYLAGVGVAFKLVLAMTMLMKKSTTECFNKYVSLAAIGTVADIVELQGENRIIADRGIRRLSGEMGEGIKALLEICGAADKPINSTTVAFMLAPRINAAGRMENASVAAELLLSESHIDAHRLATQLDGLNRQRQSIERDMYADAVKMLKDNPELCERRVIVLAHEDWHHGVIGIVASKLTELLYKPCILISVDGKGKGKGSGRSVEGINLFDALTACDDCLTQFGGHALAAGLSLDAEKLDEFSEKINKYVTENVPEEPQKTLDIDCTVPTSFVTIENARLLERFEPFGMANEKPVFALCGVKVKEAVTMGADDKHLRIKLDLNGKEIEAVGFSFGNYAKYLTPGRMIDIAFNLDINNFRGSEKVQLLLKDIKSSRQ